MDDVTLANGRIETDKSDKTDSISNSEFLRTLFGGLSEDVCPVVVSFVGNPRNVPPSAWSGRPWRADDATISVPDAANNYFSLAVFRPDDTGRYRRKKRHFHALHAVMLDDIGGKVKMDRLTVRPSWLLETSAGNYQAGYLLQEALTDGGLVDRLMNAIVDAGLCDPGANGPRARLARLPVAVNGKQLPPFRCRLIEWEPELRYSAAELADGLQLAMGESQRKPTRTRNSRQESVHDVDPIWIPRPQENAVVARPPSVQAFLMRR